MASINISFLSCRGRGMSYDMNLIHTHLSQIIPDAEFRYFVTNEVSSNYMVRNGISASKKAFCKKAENLICTDISFNNKTPIASQDGKKILVAVPFGYQFEKAILPDDKIVVKNTLRAFSHILVPSPFTKTVFEKNYNWDGIKMIDEVCSPFAWEINQPQCRDAIRKQLTFYYPEMEGKKILVISTTGKLSPNKQNEWASFPIRNFIDQLDDGWFILTNCKELLNASSALPNHYKSKLGFVSKLLPGADLLYVADALVTNNSMYASCFASRKQPIYCIEYSNTNMEKYIKQHYPQIYLDNLADLFLKKDLTDIDSDFCEHFSYSADRNPYDAIKNILTGK